MNSLQDFEKAIMNAALNIESEKDAMELAELLVQQQIWFNSLGEDNMKLHYQEYKETNKRLVNFLLELKEGTKDMMTSAVNSHSVRQKYRLYD